MSNRRPIRQFAKIYSHQHYLAETTIYQKLATHAKKLKRKEPYALTYSESLRALKRKNKGWKKYPPKMPVLTVRCPKCHKDELLCFDDGYVVCGYCTYHADILTPE